ncbi:hypothetical protein M0804_009215 [Polistes exclamans]|nr:hypothetical protein M0804_009215 [Polistes exclamans]
MSENAMLIEFLIGFVPRPFDVERTGSRKDSMALTDRYRRVICFTASLSNDDDEEEEEEEEKEEDDDDDDDDEEEEEDEKRRRIKRKRKKIYKRNRPTQTPPC